MPTVLGVGDLVGVGGRGVGGLAEGEGVYVGVKVGVIGGGFVSVGGGGFVGGGFVGGGGEVTLNSTAVQSLLGNPWHAMILWSPVDVLPGMVTFVVHEPSLEGENSPSWVPPTESKKIGYLGLL